MEKYAKLLSSFEKGLFEKHNTVTAQAARALIVAANK
jgi:hypothetical protein